MFLFHQLTIEGCCLFLPLHDVTLPAEPSMNIPENLCRAFHARLLPDTLVLCLPRVHASSADAPHYGAGAVEIPMQAHAFSHSVGGRSRVSFLFYLSCWTMSCWNVSSFSYLSEPFILLGWQSFASFTLAPSRAYWLSRDL